MNRLTKSGTIRVLASIIKDALDLIYYSTQLKSRSFKGNGKLETFLSRISSDALELREKIRGTK